MVMMMIRKTVVSNEDCSRSMRHFCFSSKKMKLFMKLNRIVICHYKAESLYDLIRYLYRTSIAFVIVLKLLGWKISKLKRKTCVLKSLC